MTACGNSHSMYQFLLSIFRKIDLVKRKNLWVLWKDSQELEEGWVLIFKTMWFIFILVELTMNMFDVHICKQNCKNSIRRARHLVWPRELLNYIWALFRIFEPYIVSSKSSSSILELKETRLSIPEWCSKWQCVVKAKLANESEMQAQSVFRVNSEWYLQIVDSMAKARSNSILLDPGA